MDFLKNISPDAGRSDRELLKEYKETGSLTVLATLYQRYMELVYGVCLKYFKEPERSKDAVMNIFEELTEKLLHHDVGNFKSWLYSVVRNHCLMELRTPKNLKVVEFETGYMQSGELLHLNDVMSKEENLDKLEKCVEQLPEQQRKSIRLFYLQKKCYDEIVEITGYEWNKVKSYIQNARRNLKICMEKENET